MAGTQTSTVDPQRAEAALRALEPRLRAIPEGELQSPRAHPQRAAQAALAVVELLSHPEVRQRFDRLSAAGLLDAAVVGELEPAALAAWQAKAELDRSTPSSAADMPAPLFQEATAMRSRMLRVLEYHRGEDPAVAARLAAIRGGKGHQDLANDLLTLSELYRAQREALAEDRRHYRASDEADAARVAREILELLSRNGNPDLLRWTELVARSWTHLQRIYDEVRRAGQFLFYHEEPESKFPPLVAATRAQKTTSLST